MSPSLLFVDDLEPWLRALERELTAHRPAWRCRWTSSAEEALLLLAAEPTDIVVTHYDTPGMNGMEPLAVVQQRYRAARRVMVSPGVQGDDVPEVVLTRPTEVALLIAALDALVDEVQ